MSPTASPHFILHQLADIFIVSEANGNPSTAIATSTDPRVKYRSYFPADVLPA
jgi:hypothetical protein